MPPELTVLGIESSCDDTAAAVVSGTPDQARIRSSIVYSQNDLHAAFGGVVPEIAARAHAEKLDLAVEEALGAADVALAEVDAIAVTAGPGLIGGVLSGVMLAKGLAAAMDKPLIGVNHLAGHALTPVLTDSVVYPFLMLLISGGHCQFLIVQGDNQFTRLGGTIDDAPGEAFDKCARLLGVGQPGGPRVEALAAQGDAERVPLPRPLLDRPDCDMSFSGLKTAFLRARNDIVAVKGGLAVTDQQDLAAAFQMAVADILATKSRRALAHYLAQSPERPCFAVAGGVAANALIRDRLMDEAKRAGAAFVAPPVSLCTDNAAMIAHVGLLRLAKGDVDTLSLEARPRWPLDRQIAPMLGSGKKGAKA